MTASTSIAGVKEDGTALGRDVMGKLGTKAAVTSMGSAISGSSPLSTVDRNTSFKAAVTSGMEGKVLEIDLSDSLGDLAVTVKVDNDLDGRFDQTMSTPWVSGVCDNGFVSCDRGTWSGCRFLGWGYQGGSLGYQPADLSSLRNCYCTNASCGQGYTSSSDLKGILDRIEKGILGAIHTAKPDFTVGQYDEHGQILSWEGDPQAVTVTRTYSGALAATNFTAQQGTGGAFGLPASPSGYYGDAGALNHDAAGYTGTEVYQLSSRTDSEAAACRVQRNVWHEAVYTTPTFPGNACGFSFTRNDCDWGRLSVSINGGQVQGDMYAQGCRGQCGYGGNAAPFPAGSWTQVGYARPHWANSCRSLTGYYRVSYSGCDAYLELLIDGYATWRHTCTGNRCRNELREATDDQCSSLEGDTSCHLVEEKIDGVYTLKAGVTTGEQPAPSCRSIQGETICRDWWLKERVYACERPGAYDFSALKGRTDALAQTTRYENHDFSYTEGGAGQTADMTNAEPGSQCKPSCKVAQVDASEPVYLDTQAPDTRAVETKSREWRECPKTASGYVCPVEPGEAIEQDCECSQGQDFGKAVSVLSSVDAASHDFSCNSPETGGACTDIAIFAGSGQSCREAGVETGFFNCCSQDVAWLIGQCGEGERDLQKAKDAGACHYVGIKCVADFLGVCLQEKRFYCCFNSKLARIVQEQGRPQLGISWGDPDNPRCRGFSPEEFQRLDFSRMDLSEFYGDIQATAQGQIEQTVRQNVERYLETYR